MTPFQEFSFVFAALFVITNPIGNLESTERKNIFKWDQSVNNFSNESGN